ncbi:unnamed protein product [Rotaria magnacalcarata]|uniref:Uncharacterized protein n=4 Tax=Rotaria magnacalcarata TaxID=392030 RepID=A0A818XHL0_9BILA|nr:unnamed protein product [Rotaria magnacalcarata]CAF2143915.1 unnamed protein product [Rotaria magnacalcarata]CAF3740579.1 unnamed protein product [Rotaria magnacalcarata]CAF3741940.1 unnamed protein product [Rotaria magnacalcarata]
MSSLVIGLDIGGSHITATLVRIEQLSHRVLSIEKDKLYSLTYEQSIRKDPRSIISTWIDCIHELLHDLVDELKEDDTIIGIACGIPGPMDYERGISYIQSSTLHKYNHFFGLNLRLSFEYGLRELVSCWKHQSNVKCDTLSVSSSSSARSYSKQEINPEKSQQIKQIATITSVKSDTFNFTEAVTTPNGEIEEQEFSIKDTRNYCGRPDDADFYKKYEKNDSTHQINFDNTEVNSTEKSITIENSSAILLPIMEQLSDIPISFYNDATCFAVGEAMSIQHKAYQRILALTLGTGFGSTFIDQNEIIKNRCDVPPGGMLWNYPYDDKSIADDWFSIRGLINIYNTILQQESLDNHSHMSINKEKLILNINNKSNTLDGVSLAAQASNGDENALKAFQIFAECLGNFLIPHIKNFKADLIVIGGGLAQTWHFIKNELDKTIKKFCNTEVYFSLAHEKSICLGAVQQQLSILFQSKNSCFRKTCQNLLPAIKTIDSTQYDLYPCHDIPIGFIGIGHKQLNEEMFRLVEQNQILLIDGFVGTYFDEYAYELNKYYSQTKKRKMSTSLIFYDTRTFLKMDSNSKKELYLQYSKSIFGKIATDLDFKKDFIDLNKLNYLKNNLSYPCVVIGPGASFINDISPLIYIDLPKNELYYRVAAETSCSYLKPTEIVQQESSSKSNDNDDYELTQDMYEKKCLYFLDYPVFNKLKQKLLSRMTFFVDGQRPNCPTWLHGHTFRQALAHLANVPIRVRPWFESGPWGGEWLKSICTNLSQLSRNYAWSFEMITPENGILLSDENHHLLEFSWDLFYGSQANRILGNYEHYRLFGGSNDFPIRFDFLDTMDGGNLSIQCHPNLEYMRTNFGEKITQDETYYIVETKQHWKEEYNNDNKSSAHVYLGFHDNVDSEEFHQALLSSRREQKELNVEKYIQSIPSNIHDFFLIPNETIHASGQNQVVLEISATPYIYTFKLYDWLRLGLDGHLRPLNIERGMKNLKFDRRGEQLRCQPVTMKFEQEKYEEQYLPTHNLHFYDVERLIIQSDESIEIIRSTENRFHLCILVEGDAIEVEFNTIDNDHQKQLRQYNYIETFLIPASITQYRLRPIIKNQNNKKKPRQFVLLITFLKWDCEKLLD